MQPKRTGSKERERAWCWQTSQTHPCDSNSAWPPPTSDTRATRPTHKRTVRGRHDRAAGDSPTQRPQQPTGVHPRAHVPAWSTPGAMSMTTSEPFPNWALRRSVLRLFCTNATCSSFSFSTTCVRSIMSLVIVQTGSRLSSRHAAVEWRMDWLLSRDTFDMLNSGSSELSHRTYWRPWRLSFFGRILKLRKPP